MLARATRLLARLRGAPASAGRVELPPWQWSDDLREAGLDAASWIAARQSAARLYVGLPDQRIEHLRTRYPDLVRATIDAAERVLRHEFDLLGSGPYTPVDPERSPDENGYRPIDWYLDPVSGCRFPRGIPRAAFNLETMRPPHADIKLPWELARCQHWPLLGQAYKLTGDDRFALEIARELRDFMEANPVGTAVNWSCTMDVALRAANWALALELIRSCRMPAPLWHAAYDALFEHGVFIERHLENTFEVTSNHFLSNVVGLFYVAAVFRDLPRGRTWDRQCRRWLAEEMDAQVLPDGADYESSVPYHRLVTELLLGAARVADQAGAPMPSAWLARLRSMVDYLFAVLRPDGLMPQIGDADDGRLHVLSGYGRWKPQDPRHLLGPAASFFGEGAWMRAADEGARWESEWWGLDPSLVTSSAIEARRDLSHFPYAGVTVMRRGADCLFVTNGVVGTGGFGNHKHNDLLGFEYHVDGQAVVVDPGSYVYTSDPDARNLFRSAQFHNTIVVDGQEPNEIRPDWLFRTFEKAAPEHLRVSEDADAFEYCGRHTGYTRLPQPVVHERTFRLSRSDRSLAIVDALEGRGTHRLRWHFHFSPGVSASAQSGGCVEIRAGSTTMRLTVPPALRLTIAAAWYSPSYGVREPCVAVDAELTATLDGRHEYTFDLTPR